MIEGTLIAESIRVDAELSGVRLVARKIRRAALGDVSAGQPEVWTVIEFEAEEPDAGALAAANEVKPLISTAIAYFWGQLDYYYYAALTVAALWEKASHDEQTRSKSLARKPLATQPVFDQAATFEAIDHYELPGADA